MRTIIGIVVLSAFFVAIYFLNGATRTTDGKSVLNVAGELPVTVKAADPESRNIVRTVQAPGEVEPLQEVDISAEVVAKILHMPVEEGDPVQKGDLLCRLDDADYRARLTSADANVAKLKAVIVQAQADFAKAERDYQRQIDLAEADATSALELADYRTALVRARALMDIRKQELVEAEAMLQSAREDLEKTVITAPIDGIISQLFAKEGEVVVTGTMNNPGTRIMVISDLSTMQVRCRVDESDAPWVKPDQVARIFLQSDTQDSVPGRVLRVGTKGTRPQGRDVVTFETLVLVDSTDERVKPGMTANIEIEVDRRDNAIIVPVEAVVHRKRRDLPSTLVEAFDKQQADRDPGRRGRIAEYLKIIFCIEDEIAHPRLVETGISDETGVEILSGIGLEDRVVIGPYRSLDQLKEGSKIKLDEAQKEKEGEAGTIEDGEMTTEKHDDAEGKNGGETQSRQAADPQSQDTLAENRK